MALTRKFLRALEIPEDKIDEIIGEHTSALESIKAERDELKAAAGDLAKAQAEIARLTGEIEKVQKASGDAAKVQAEFDAYRQQVDEEKANAAKLKAVREVLRGAGVQREEFIDLLLGKVDISAIEIDGNAVKEPEKVIGPLRDSYSGCFATVQTKGTPPVSPPKGGGGGMSKADILQIKDAQARQQAIAENHELFGF